MVYPDSEEPVEILQYESGSPSDGTGSKISVTKSKENPPYGIYMGTSSDCSVSVTPKYNGLYIEKSHDAVWEGESKWPNNLPLYKSVLDLSKVKSFLLGQPTIFVSITLKFTYNKINYEYTILENNKNLF